MEPSNVNSSKFLLELTQPQLGWFEVTIYDWLACNHTCIQEEPDPKDKEILRQGEAEWYDVYKRIRTLQGKPQDDMSWKL